MQAEVIFNDNDFQRLIEQEELHDQQNEHQYKIEKKSKGFVSRVVSKGKGDTNDRSMKSYKQYIRVKHEKLQEPLVRNKSKEKADLTDRSDTRFFQSVIKSETPVGKIKESMLQKNTHFFKFKVDKSMTQHEKSHLKRTNYSEMRIKKQGEDIERKKIKAFQQINQYQKTCQSFGVYTQSVIDFRVQTLRNAKLMRIQQENEDLEQQIQPVNHELLELKQKDMLTYLENVMTKPQLDKKYEAVKNVDFHQRRIKELFKKTQAITTQTR